MECTRITIRTPDGTNIYILVLSDNSILYTYKLDTKIYIHPDFISFYLDPPTNHELRHDIGIELTRALFFKIAKSLI